MNSKMSSAFSFILSLPCSRIARTHKCHCFTLLLIPDIILTLRAGFNDVSALTLIRRRYAELGKDGLLLNTQSMPFKFSIFVK